MHALLLAHCCFQVACQTCLASCAGIDFLWRVVLDMPSQESQVINASQAVVRASQEMLIKLYQQRNTDAPVSPALCEHFIRWADVLLTARQQVCRTLHCHAANDESKTNTGSEPTATSNIAGMVSMLLRSCYLLHACSLKYPCNVKAAHLPLQVLCGQLVGCSRWRTDWEHSPDSAAVSSKSC